MIDRSKDSLIRLADVKRRTGLSRTTIYKKVGQGKFPKPTPISEGLVAWYESDIDTWVANPMGWATAA